MHAKNKIQLVDDTLLSLRDVSVVVTSVNALLPVPWAQLYVHKDLITVIKAC